MFPAGSAHVLRRYRSAEWCAGAFIGGPLFEEPGWTGFAQPRLQRLCGPLIGGLILGSLWLCGICLDF